MTTPARLRTPRTDRARAALAPAPPAPHERRAGFVLYVNLPAEVEGEQPAASTADLAETADILRELAQDALPGAETFTALSLASSADPTDRRGAHLRLLGPADGHDPGDHDVLSGSGDAR